VAAVFIIDLGDPEEIRDIMEEIQRLQNYFSKCRADTALVLHAFIE